MANRSWLPYSISGEIVRGFGRGSNELGFPTANYPSSVVDALPDSFECGIYYGWAKVNEYPVYPMVLSLGYNPFYNNTKKTMEIHILHNFSNDLYGSHMTVVMIGFLREEKSFKSTEDLIDAIEQDIAIAKEMLQKAECLRLKESFSYDL
ncbi:hypothetical protein HELRODRAFT_67925 [Helobdella robusta]|uniref:riboflavin kinase n=1 Tax=Helobdella robusta TaxID=6412 RepID=T1FZ78_HELRO|nr:hypothetical protein HELRODRAFT_67925 [Helobdella robusta]ESN96779.1 hypothetical protein HELRODRAFT_67925 [Helobdella robusta]